MRLRRRSFLDPSAVEVLLTTVGDDAGAPVVGGPARIDEIDKTLARQMAPWRPAPPARAFLAYLVATRTGLYYIVPGLSVPEYLAAGAHAVYGWRWDAIASIKATRRFWKFGGLLVETNQGDAVEIRTAASVAAGVLSMGER